MTWPITLLNPFRRSSDSSSTSSSSSSSSSFPTPSSPQQIVISATPPAQNSAGTGTNSSNKTPSPTKITISATPHTPISATVSSSSSNTTKNSSPSTVPTGAISPSETYTHESGFVLNGKIYSFKLDIPIGEKPEDSEKESLNKAIQSYKNKFIDHLKKQNLDIVNSGKAFDIEFQGDQGYKLSQTQNTQQAPSEEKVHNDEAKQFANLICTSNQNAKFITSLLDNPDNYPKQLPPAPAPTAAPSTSTTPPPSSASPEKNDNVGSPPPAQNPTTNASSKVAPPQIAHSQNSCYAASVLWYLHNDAEILTALPQAISNAKDTEKSLLENLKKLLEDMQQGKNIAANEIAGFIQSLAAAKSESRISVTIGETGDAREIINYFQKIILGSQRLEILRGDSDQINSIEFKAKINSSKIQNSFEFTQEPNQLSDSIPLELTINNHTYRLTKALCYSGNRENGHYTALVATGDGKYYHCDDVEYTNPKVVPEETANALLREKAVKLLYVKQPASPATSTSQSPHAQNASKITPDKTTGTPAILLNNSGAVFIPNILTSASLLYQAPSSANHQSSEQTWTIPEETTNGNLDLWKSVKDEIASAIIEESDKNIILHSSSIGIKFVTEYANKLVKLNVQKYPTISVGGFSFEAPNGGTETYSISSNSSIEKVVNGKILSTLYLETLQEQSYQNNQELIFNLRSQSLQIAEFANNGLYTPVSQNYQIFGDTYDRNYDEQKTLDNLLKVIAANSLPKDKKIRLIISKDILIKNFEKIEAALKSATEKSNNAPPKENGKNVPSTPIDNNTPSNPPSSIPKNLGSTLKNLGSTLWDSTSRTVDRFGTRVSDYILEKGFTRG